MQIFLCSLTVKTINFQRNESFEIIEICIAGLKRQAGYATDYYDQHDVNEYMSLYVKSVN